MLFADYRGLSGQAYVQAIQGVEKAILDLGAKGKRDIKILSDVTGTVAEIPVIEAFKSVASKMRPYVKGSAILGITGIKKYTLQLVNKFSAVETKPFETAEEAKDWLASL